MAVMGRGLQCPVPVGTVNAHTVSLLSSSPLMPPPLLLHSPLRPLLATAGFLQLRLSLCFFFPLVLASLVRIRDGGPWPFPSALEHIPSPRHCEAH